MFKKILSLVLLALVNFFLLVVPEVYAKPGYTNSKMATLTLSATDTGSGMGAGAEMRFSNDGQNWSGPEPFATTRGNWDLTAYGGGTADGTKTVYVRFKDSAGNWSVDEITTSIILDTTLPLTTASPGGGNYSQPQVVTLSCTEEAIIYYTTDGSEPTTVSAVYTSPITISTSTTLKFFALDNAENMEAVKTEVYTIDTSAPSGNLTINDGDATINSTTVSLTITESADVVGWLVSETHSSKPDVNDPAWMSVKPTSYNLSSGDGTKTLYGWFKDEVGNVSLAAATDTILLDTIPPIGTIAIAP